MANTIWHPVTSSTSRDLPRVYPLFSAKWLPEATVNNKDSEPCLCNMTWQHGSAPLGLHNYFRAAAFYLDEN